MPEIGAGWWRAKKDRNGEIVKDDRGNQVYQLSVNLRIPFLGEINLTLSPNPEKKNVDAKQSIPDYIVYWWPPRTQPNSPSKNGPMGPINGPSEGPEFGEDAY